MEVNDQHQAPNHFTPPRKGPRNSQMGDRWAPEPISTFQRTEKSHTPAESRKTIALDLSP